MAPGNPWARRSSKASWFAHGRIGVKGAWTTKAAAYRTERRWKWEEVDLSESVNQHDIYLEIGRKRAFAGSVDWPGWCRSGRNEEAAIQALLDTASRYSRVLGETGLAFEVPEGTSSFNVVERLEGNATTDFGAPAVPLSTDEEPIGADELRRLQSLLQSC